MTTRDVFFFREYLITSLAFLLKEGLVNMSMNIWEILHNFAMFSIYTNIDMHLATLHRSEV